MIKQVSLRREIVSFRVTDNRDVSFIFFNRPMIHKKTRENENTISSWNVLKNRLGQSWIWNCDLAYVDLRVV